MSRGILTDVFVVYSAFPGERAGDDKLPAIITYSE